MKSFLVWFALVFGVLVLYFSVRSPSPSVAVEKPLTWTPPPNPVATTTVSHPVATPVSSPVAVSGRVQAEQYMSCLGIAPSKADTLWTATRADMNKFLIASHMVVTGDLTDTPLTLRERTCRQRSSL
jgi:hypothetical protein